MLNSNHPLPFDTVLVANRGEIAVRVIRTLRTMGMRSVAVYSDADAGAAHVRAADTAVRLGPAPARDSYLNIDRVVDAARRTGCRRGPPRIRVPLRECRVRRRTRRRRDRLPGSPGEGDRDHGRQDHRQDHGRRVGVPVVPGIAEPGLTDAALIAAAAEIGYPVLVKPSAGGGGKGMRRGRAIRPICPRHWSAPGARPRPPSVTTPCSWSASSPAPGTSRCRSSPTATATSCTSANASAACSGVTRR